MATYTDELSEAIEIAREKALQYRYWYKVVEGPVKGRYAVMHADDADSLIAMDPKKYSEAHSAAPYKTLQEG